MHPVNQTRIVLQGEFAIINGKETPGKIQTSSPRNCTVLTLFEPKSKITALGHFDDYTDVKATIKKIEIICKNRFGINLDSSFKATISGGINETFSIQTQENLKKALAKRNVHFEKVELGKSHKPEVEITSDQGVVNVLSIPDAGLEVLQMREYGAWNDFLDLRYPVGGEDPPYYPGKEARRTNIDVPNLNIAGLSAVEQIDRGLELLYAGGLRLKIDPDRSLKGTIQSFKELKLLATNVPDKMKQAIKAKDFNLLLRLSASDTKCQRILTYLLKHRAELEINLHARGATSGTALDVAQRFNNTSAEKLLREAMSQ